MEKWDKAQKEFEEAKLKYQKAEEEYKKYESFKRSVHSIEKDEFGNLIVLVIEKYVFSTYDRDKREHPWFYFNDPFLSIDHKIYDSNEEQLEILRRWFSKK
jgi:hypothetical protein